MPIYEFHLTVFNNPNQGNKLRHDEGDIINIQNSGVGLGRKVLDYFLIVPVDINTLLTTDALKTRLCTDLYDDGSLEDVDWRDILYDVFGVDRIVYPPDLYVWDLHSLQPRLRPTRLARFRYKMVLADLADIDLVETQDVESIYQPFLRESRLAQLDCFTSPNSNYHIRKQGNTYRTWKSHNKRRNIHEEIVGGKIVRYIIKGEPIIIEPVTIQINRGINCKTQSIKKNDEYIWPSANLVVDKFDDSYVDLEAL